MSPDRRSIRAFAVAACAVASTIAPAGWARGLPEPPADPVLVVTRAVQPRIAYRALQRDDNPVAAQATLFPSRAFAGALGGATAQLIGDDALGQRGSAGIGVAPAVDAALQPMASSLAGNQVTAAAAAPMAMGPAARGGGIAGAVLDATAGLGALLGGRHP